MVKIVGSIRVMCEIPGMTRMSEEKANGLASRLKISDSARKRIMHAEDAKAEMYSRARFYLIGNPYPNNYPK